MNVFTFTEKMARGQYPVNVPTSMALESLMNIHPTLTHDESPHLKYQHYWMNLRTLYRNVTGSFTADINSMLKPMVIAELLHDEWEAVKRVLADTKIDPTLYLCNYKAIYSRYRHHSVFKSDKTPKQEEERVRMEKSIQQFLNDVGKDYVKGFDTDIAPPKKDGNFLIQTHIAWDLLSYKSFEELDLIESHTGAIKNRSLWYTKLNNGKDLSMIPFTQYFARIFGEKEFFSPMDSDLRKAIVDLGTKYGWSALTTDARVRMNLDQLKNPFFTATVKDMM
jgi:hypothetical protein